MQPHMQIFIRGHRVYSRRLRYSLWKKEDFVYRPNSVGQQSQVYITFGFNTRNKQHMGCFIYHRNRLIKMYMRVGIQFASDSRGVGVIGVVDASFLTPTHNKQDFVQNNLLKLLTNTLKDRLKDYWSNCNIDVAGGGIGIANWWSLLARAPNKDLRWRQCDNISCLKWRKLEKGYTPEPYVEWRCTMHPNKKYNCAMPEQPPDYKIAPKRKREDLLEAIVNKRPHIDPNTFPTTTSPSPSPSPALPGMRFNPPLVSPIEASQKFREQIAQRQAVHQQQQAQLAKQQQQALELGQTQQLLQQQQQIRERLAQHHQRHFKQEPTASTHPTASQAQHESFMRQQHQPQAPRVSQVISNPPAVVNLTEHEHDCKGCQTMCRKMTGLVNMLGANISCEDLHSSRFDPQMFVFQIRDSFLHEIDTLKQELAVARTRNATLESGQVSAQRMEAAHAPSTPPRANLPTTDLPTTKVYHLGVDSGSVGERYNTFLTNYRYIDDKLARGAATPSSPSRPSPFSSSPIIIPASSSPPSNSTPPTPVKTNPNTTTPIIPDNPSTSSTAAPSNTTTSSSSTFNASTNSSNINPPNTTTDTPKPTSSTTTNTTTTPPVANDRLFVGRVSMLDLLTRKNTPTVDPPPPPSTPVSTPSPVSSAPTSSSTDSPHSAAAPDSTASRVRIQKVNVKAEPADDLYPLPSPSFPPPPPSPPLPPPPLFFDYIRYEYANQEAIHITSSQDSQAVN